MRGEHDFRYSDDGEPSGSAGRPILQQIDGRDLTDVLANPAGFQIPSMIVKQSVAGREEFTDLPPPAIRAVADQKLSLVALDGYEDHHPHGISGGMKKRAAIARALALEPELLFLHEPSAGLDPIASAELDDLILVLNETLGNTMVMVTHELPSILRVGKSCIMLDKETKSIIARGKPKALAKDSSDERVTRFFGRSMA